jgi:hypothetical protein
MSRHRDRLILTGEIGWLIIPMTMLTVLAVQEPSVWRFVWLTVLVVSAAVVGRRVRRVSQQLRAGSSRTDRRSAP